MRPYKGNSKSARATHASVKQEMGKPRMAKSVRIMELNLDTTRTREEPSASMPAHVDKIIPTLRPGMPEEVQIALDGPSRRHRDFRIENVLTDEYGDDVKLKGGAHVQVTVTADSKWRKTFLVSD